MKYTHILSIQIWSDKLNQTTNYANILSKVKNEIVNKTQTQKLISNGKYELITVLWKSSEWNTLEKTLYSADIVTWMPEIYDELIYTHTKCMLNEITEQLYRDKKFNLDHKIIFGIVKPIQPDFLEPNNCLVIKDHLETKDYLEIEYSTIEKVYENSL